MIRSINNTHLGEILKIKPDFLVKNGILIISIILIFIFAASWKISYYQSFISNGTFKEFPYRVPVFERNGGVLKSFFTSSESSIEKGGAIAVLNNNGLEHSIISNVPGTFHVNDGITVGTKVAADSQIGEISGINHGLKALLPKDANNKVSLAAEVTLILNIENNKQIVLHGSINEVYIDSLNSEFVAIDVLLDDFQEKKSQIKQLTFFNTKIIIKQKSIGQELWNSLKKIF